MNASITTDIETTAKAGFKALELGAWKIDEFLKTHTINDLKSLLVKHQVEPVTLNSIEFIAFRGSEYKQIQERCRLLSQWCQVVGCPVLILVPSPTYDWKIPWDKVVEEYVTVLRDLDDIAKPYGINIALEFLGFGWSTVRTPRGTLEIIRKTGRDHIGMILDCMHFYAGGGLLEEVKALDPKRLYGFHIDDMENVPKEGITDQKRLIPGLGVIPLTDICKALASTGYDGVCSTELFRPEYFDWDPVELAKKTKEHALKLLSPYFRID